MRPIDKSLSDADLQQRRIAIRRDLVRGNTTAILLLVALVGLALLAALKASQADVARREATEKLWDSYRAQARAARLSGEAGRRAEALGAIQAAAKISPSDELENEAIAALALTDIEPLTNFVSFTSEPFGVSFDSDFSRYALRTAEKVEVRSMENQQTLMSIGATSLPDAARFTEDGKLLALGFRNGEMEIRELATTNVVWSAKVKEGWAGNFDLSQDSRRMVYRPTPTNIVVMDLETKEALHSVDVPADQPTALFSPNGKLISANSGKRITVWSIEDAEPKKLKEFNSPSTMLSIAWHHESGEIAVGCEDHAIRIWDIKTGRVGRIDGHTREVISVIYSPTSDLLVSYSWDGNTRVWNSRTGDLLVRSQQGWARAFSGDGKKLSYVKPNKGFGFWKVVEPEAFSIFGYPLRGDSWMRWVDFSPDGSLLGIGYYSQAQVWDVATRRLVAEIPGRDIKTIAFTEAGHLLISDVRGAREWRLEKKDGWMEPTEVSPPVFDKWKDKSVVLSKDRRTAAVAGGHDHNLAVINLATRKMKELGYQHNSANVAISPDGSKFGVGTWKGSGTHIWKIGDEQGAVSLDKRDAFVGFDAKGEWFLAGHGDEYCFWDTRTWSNVWSLKRDVPVHGTGPMAFSRNGEILAVSLTGWSLDLVDTGKREVAAKLTSPLLNPVTVLAASDDGTKVAASVSEGYVQVWDLPKVREGLASFGLRFLEENGRGGQIVSPGIFSSTVFTGIIALALLSALFVGFTGLKRHRRLVDEYSAIEKLVMERNAQLEGYRAELAHSQKMRALGTLAAGIAHDFNNLLSVIRMANKLTAKEASLNMDVRENIAVVEQAVEQGKQVVKSMLGYSRASGADEGAYSVAELVENVVPLLSKQFLAGISLTLELDYTTPTVSRARTRLQQVLLNLIVNASEAMGGHGKLKIAVKTQRDVDRQFIRKPESSPMYVRLSVADSGPGIAADVLPRIFEPFFTTKNVGAEPGTGLGLSLVYTVAEEEGLGLAIETAPGLGATFYIYIPASVENDVKQEAATRPDTQMSQAGRA